MVSLVLLAVAILVVLGTTLYVVGVYATARLHPRLYPGAAIATMSAPLEVQVRAGDTWSRRGAVRGERG